MRAPATVLATVRTQPPAGDTESSFSEVYSDALRGEACSVHGNFPGRELPVHEWLRPATRADRELLGRCRGTTLDVGCGPGRMSAHLAACGHGVLGIDLVGEAVTQTRRLGPAAIRRNFFDPMPGEGSWDTVLLADGNIGIGGAPVRLLRRAAELLDRDGRVVCDLAAPGTGVPCHYARLVTELKRSRPFPWASVGPEAVPSLASDAGLRMAELGHHRGRWFAVLVR